LIYTSGFGPIRSSLHLHFDVDSSNYFFTSYFGADSSVSRDNHLLKYQFPIERAGAQSINVSGVLNNLPASVERKNLHVVVYSSTQKDPKSYFDPERNAKVYYGVGPRSEAAKIVIQ